MMGHLRKRFIQSSLDQLTRFSPLIGILGHRQVGKTTLLTSASKNYVTLDDKDLLQQAQNTPKLFLQEHQGKLLAIDECQLAPHLFPALKEHVRINKKPGQFLLSGSVRFTSRKAIRESLTGRIMNLELLPFSISEIHHKELPDIIFDLLSNERLENSLQRCLGKINHSKSLDKEIDKYCDHGGLPGIFFVRNPQLRQKKIEEQLMTILDRDLRLVYPTTLPYSQILDFVTFLSSIEGQKINYTQIRAATGISESTQKKLLYSLEAVFVIRRLPIQSGEKGHVLYFEDQAEALHLAQHKKPLEVQYEGLVYRNARVQLYYRLGESFRFFHYSTRGGARVPICLEHQKGILGFIPIFEEKPNLSQKASARSLLKTFNNSKVIFLSRKAKPEVFDSRTCLLPTSVVL